LTVVLLGLAAASEVGRWFAGSRRGRVAASLLAPAVLAVGVSAARHVVTQERFRAVAFENYTDNEGLRVALDSIRADLTADDRLAIVGQGNELSPALFRWELGPPSGVPCFPFEIGGARGTDLALANRVLLMVPADSGPAALDPTSYYLTQRRVVQEGIDRGEFALRRELPLSDLHVALRLYDRTSLQNHKSECD
jgi:hypothetical protein